MHVYGTNISACDSYFSALFDIGADLYVAIMGRGELLQDLLSAISLRVGLLQS